MKKLNLRNTEFRRLEKSFGEWLAILGYSESTVYQLPIHLRNFLHFLENQEVEEISKISGQHVSQYFTLLQGRKNERRGGSISAAHFNKHRQALVCFNKYVHQQKGLLLPNPGQLLVGEGNQFEVLTKKEIEALYQACELSGQLKSRDITMLDLYYSCGLRRSEAVQLNVDDIDLQRRRIHIRYTKNRHSRLVPFTESVLRNLYIYLEEREFYFLTNRLEQAFLLSLQGKRIQGQSLYLRLKRLQSLSDLECLQNKSIGLHTLRHSIATHLLAEGMDLELIGHFLGHRSLDATQIYTHLKEEDASF